MNTPDLSSVPKKDGRTLAWQLIGIIMSIRGSMEDIEVPENIPVIHTTLIWEEKAGLRMELKHQLGKNGVKTMALRPTDGPSRGKWVTIIRSPLKPAAGYKVLSRVRQGIIDESIFYLISRIEALKEEKQNKFYAA